MADTPYSLNTNNTTTDTQLAAIITLLTNIDGELVFSNNRTRFGNISSVEFSGATMSDIKASLDAFLAANPMAQFVSMSVAVDLTGGFSALLMYKL